MKKKNTEHKLMNRISDDGRDQLLISFLPLAADVLLWRVLLGIYPVVLAEMPEYTGSF